MADQTQDNPRGAPDSTITDDREISEQEKSMVARWRARLAAAKSSMGNDLEEKINRYRKYVAGKQHSDGETGLVRANLIHAHIKKSTSRTYARNPEFSIKPSEQVNSQSYKKWRMFGKTLEIVLNRHLEDARLKKHAKAAVRAAKTSRIGWLKLGYFDVMGPNPEFPKLRGDTQEKLDHLRSLRETMFHPDEIRENDFRQEELERALQALEQDKEIVISTGIRFNLVDTKNIIIDLSTINNFEDYHEAPFIAERHWMTVDRYKAIFKQEPVGADIFDSTAGKESNATSHSREGKTNHKGDNLVAVHEIWNAADGLVTYIAEGSERYAKEPQIPPVKTEHFFPYFPLALNPVDGQFWPLSDVELLMELQDEHNKSRTSFAEHREKSRPHWVGAKNAIEEEDAKRFVNSSSGEVTLINVPPGTRVTDLIGVAEQPKIDPQVYATLHIREDMDQVTGGSEATQPTRNRSGTLGEAEILSEEISVGSSSDTDEIETWFEAMAKSVIEILLQRLTIEDVEKIAGPRAQLNEETGVLSNGVMWPSMNKQDIFNMIRMDIRPGSSGRPNKAQELRAWMELLPQLSELVVRVSELRQAGQQDLANALIKVFQETVRRQDERYDIDEFLPEITAEDQQALQTQKAQEAEEARAQNDLAKEQIKAEIIKTLSDAVRNYATAEAQEDGQQLEVITKIIELARLSLDEKQHEDQLMQQQTEAAAGQFIN